MLPQTFAAIVNHLLSQQPQARVRLSEHAGRHLRVSAPPMLLAMNIVILESGSIAMDSSGMDPDLVVSLDSARIPLVLARRSEALKHVNLAGNAALASLIQAVAAQLEWDFEEDLSRVFGDIAARRIASAGKALTAWQRDARHRVAENVSEYLTEENPMLVRHIELDQFRQDMHVLERDLDRVAVRITELRRRFAATAN